jgi:hypothetical protein
MGPKRAENLTKGNKPVQVVANIPNTISVPSVVEQGKFNLILFACYIDCSVDVSFCRTSAMRRQIYI